MCAVLYLAVVAGITWEAVCRIARYFESKSFGCGRFANAGSYVAIAAVFGLIVCTIGQY